MRSHHASARTSRRVLLAACAVLLAAGARPAPAQDKVLHWASCDVDISIRPDGSVRVVETHALAFDRGTFRFGYRDIALAFLDRISDVEVGEPGRPYRQSPADEPGTWRTESDRRTLSVRYNFEPGGPGESRTIVIGYTVTGALRGYPAKGVDQLKWVAIPAGNPFRTDASTITLHLPEGASFTNHGVNGARAETAFAPGQRDATLRIAGPLRPGQAIEVVAEWPRGAGVGAVKPPRWQAQAEAAAGRGSRRAADPPRSPLLDLFLFALGGLVAVGGPLLVFFQWQEKGRDPAVGLVAEYLPEPPSDLAPGVVGTLLDESADLKDILATLVDLARRGAVEIEEHEKGEGDFTFRRTGASVPLSAPESLLVTDLFGSESERRLSDLKEKFYTSLPGLRAALYDEAVRLGLFVERPDRVRQRYAGLGVALLAGSIGLGVLGVAAFARLSPAVVFVPMGLGATAIALLVAARFMPRKTAAGADAAARWRAFREYLEHLERFRPLEQAGDLFDRYLPHAIAFGLERSFLRKFAKVNAPAPAWWIPWGATHGGTWPDGTLPSASGPASRGGAPPPLPGSGAGRDRPSLEGASRGIGSGLSSLSKGIGTLLSSAASTFASSPQPSGGGGASGGGFSGGGGSFGGGSGGGGSRFG